MFSHGKEGVRIVKEIDKPLAEYGSSQIECEKKE
jgi:hypothetical protein